MKDAVGEAKGNLGGGEAAAKIYLLLVSFCSVLETLRDTDIWSDLRLYSCPRRKKTLPEKRCSVSSDVLAAQY